MYIAARWPASGCRPRDAARTALPAFRIHETPQRPPRRHRHRDPARRRHRSAGTSSQARPCHLCEIRSTGSFPGSPTFGNFARAHTEPHMLSSLYVEDFRDRRSRDRVRAGHDGRHHRRDRRRQVVAGRRPCCVNGAAPKPRLVKARGAVGRVRPRRPRRPARLAFRQSED